MTKRKIEIEIDCGDETCGECYWKARTNDPFCMGCGQYSKLFDMRKIDGDDPPRLPECLAAERTEQLLSKSEGEG